MTMTNFQAPPPRSRMALDAVRRGRIAQPLRVLVYGPEGVGKSTLGSKAPDPVFLGAEDGTGQLDVARFPEPRTWAEALEAVRALAAPGHPYKTLVVDTLDWLEPLCWRAVCEKEHKPNIEAFGYGKGYVAALDEWRGFVAALEVMRRATGMHVVLLGHALVKTFKNPEGDDYDRFNLKIHDKAAGLLKEWSDAVLFANYETFVDTTGHRPKGLGGGARVLHTERRAAWDAKNRFGLPERLPLDWSEFWAAVQANGADAAAALRDEIAAALPHVADEAKRAAITAWLDKVGDAPTELRLGLNRVRALAPALSQPQTQETTR